jgi:hypothetical protein
MGSKRKSDTVSIAGVPAGQHQTRVGVGSATNKLLGIARAANPTPADARAG